MTESTASPKVFFILGGPGSGKGVNCTRLAAEFGYQHFSAGELLRKASREGTSDVAKAIAEILRSGNIVPSEITVELLREAIAAHPNPHGYVIDGFPRKFDQARMFEEGIARPRGILSLSCTEQTMESRLLTRSTASGTEVRTDDNAETIRHRFRINEQTCLPVIESYQKEGRCHVIDTNRDIESVYRDVRQVFLDLGEKPLSPS